MTARRAAFCPDGVARFGRGGTLQVRPGPAAGDRRTGFFAGCRLGKIVVACGLVATSATATAAANSAPWLRGDRLVVGGDGRGPLSAGLSNHPLGAVFVHGAAGGDRGADLFVAAGRFSHEPGLFLYRWVATAADGAPVFGARESIQYPTAAGVPPAGAVFQARNGTIYGFWLVRGAILRTRFDRAARAFQPLPVLPVKIPAPAGAPASDARAPERLAVIEQTDGSLDVVLSVADGARFRPPEPPGHRDPSYQPFDGRGIWRGGWPYVHLRAGRLPGPEAKAAALAEVRVVSSTRHEALLTHGGLAVVARGDGRGFDLLTGSRFGNFSWYANRSAERIDFAAQEFLRGPDGRVLRSPIISATPIAYGRGLVVGGEGALFFLRLAGGEADGQLRAARPVEVREERALLYTGSLPVVNSVDWDGDGATDLVAGNSEGRILFFRNRGSTAAPEFAPGVPLVAGGEVIHVQQGYAGIQGPGEARWGYISPAVVDWNGDGRPDLVSSDATARHSVHLNLGAAGEPRLDVARPLYCDGLDLHGTWRVRPGAGLLGGRMAYVALDADDQFRLYWRIDDYNLRDAGKLRLADGSPIGANFLSAGGTGRSKITLADWDGDGAVDLIVGTPRHGSVPNPQTGLPQSRGLPGSAVLWLRNTGGDAAPRFAFPRLLHVRGKPVYFGQHECSAAVTNLGGGGPNLLVGDEDGRVHFFPRAEITWE
jgi:hypothetical protein